MSDPKDVKRIASNVKNKFKKINYLINNSGTNVLNPVEKIKLEDWRRIIDVNLTGVFLLTKAILPLLKKESLILSASSHGRKHNIFGLWSLDLYDKLKDDLVNNKIRKVEDWTKKNKIKNLEFKFKDYDPFFNLSLIHI